MEKPIATLHQIGMLESLGRRCLDLVDGLRNGGTRPLTSVDKAIIRMAEIPGYIEAYHVGMAEFIAGETENPFDSAKAFMEQDIYRG